MGGKGGWGVQNLFPHPNELLIWAYPENLVEIRLLVEAVETFLRMDTGHGHGNGHGDTSDYIDNLSLSFGFWPGLWLWLGYG